jgi:hypothetical protein
MSLLVHFQTLLLPIESVLYMKPFPLTAARDVCWCDNPGHPCADLLGVGHLVCLHFLKMLTLV